MSLRPPLLRLGGDADIQLQDTTFKRLVGAFRKVRKISPDKEVFIMFEGERIDPEQTMGGLDIEDQENFDAHIK